MSTTRRVAVLMMLTAALVACGDDDGGTGTTTAPVTTAPSTTPAPASTTVSPTTAPPTTQATTTVAPTTTAPATLEQPAIWPAADVVFATPEEAAADFVSQVLGVPPTLGEFQAGDSRSGEIEVFSPGDGGGELSPRGLLLLRQLGPDSGWFVIGAPSEYATVATPESGATVAAAPLTVSGVARGFEANVVVTAMVAGDATRVLDTEITMGGAMETPGPYSVTLDLSGAEPGWFVMILVRGGAGLETDPGDFGAIPVVIAG